MSEGSDLTTREELVLGWTQQCRYFTGIQNDCCAVGVEYASVRDTSARPFRYPCRRPEVATCAQRSLTTREEAEQRETEMRAGIERISRARETIVAVTKGQRSVKGRTTCPNCGGRLDFTVASNGHIWASCSTEGCARWME